MHPIYKSTIRDFTRPCVISCPSGGVSKYDKGFYDEKILICTDLTIKMH